MRCFKYAQARTGQEKDQASPSRFNHLKRSPDRFITIFYSGGITDFFLSELHDLLLDYMYVEIWGFCSLFFVNTTGKSLCHFSHTSADIRPFNGVEGCATIFVTLHELWQGVCDMMMILLFKKLTIPASPYQPDLEQRRVKRHDKLPVPTVRSLSRAKTQKHGPGNKHPHLHIHES